MATLASLQLALAPPGVTSGRILGALGIVNILSTYLLATPTYTAVFFATID
jgi:hypothetical protein